jgi:hypothetical protein
MSSTRNKNMPFEHAQQLRRFEHGGIWNQYEHGSGGRAVLTHVPGDGIVGGAQRMHCTLFASNGIDVESQLFGIGSNNLVTPKDEVFPHFTTPASMQLVSCKQPIHVPQAYTPSPTERHVYRN